MQFTLPQCLAVPFFILKVPSDPSCLIPHIQYVTKPHHFDVPNVAQIHVLLFLCALPVTSPFQATVLIHLGQGENLYSYLSNSIYAAFLSALHVASEEVFFHCGSPMLTDLLCLPVVLRIKTKVLITASVPCMTC